jgi:SAM-dependent methyltransferase
MAVPHLFDAGLSRLRLARALKAGYCDFLLRRIADDLVERLGAVKRDFRSTLDLCTPTELLSQALIGQARIGELVRAAPIAAAGADRLVQDETLSLEARRFDLVVSALALQAVNDLPGVLAQIRQALQPDGLFLAALLAGETLTELRQSFIAAEAEIEGGASPRVAPFADLRDLGTLLQRAGFALPVVDMERVVVRYGDPLALLRDLRGMGMTNPLAAQRRYLARPILMRALAVYAERFADADGKVRATFDIAWLSGWAPHESQQQPLRPGTAQRRLAEALGTVEFPSGDSPPIGEREATKP